MERSNAWERAQEAIARAAERSDDVVTPDNAVSPFDASMTTVIPHADVVRRGPPDPDSTMRLPYGRPPAPRRPYDGQHRREAPPRPPEVSDPAIPRVTSGHPGTAPFPAAPPHGTENGNGHGPHGDGTPPQGFSLADELPPEPEHRPWWKRLFGR